MVLVRTESGTLFQTAAEETRGREPALFSDAFAACCIVKVERQWRSPSDHVLTITTPLCEVLSMHISGCGSDGFVAGAKVPSRVVAKVVRPVKLQQQRLFQREIGNSSWWGASAEKR